MASQSEKNCRPSTFLGGKEEQQAPEESVNWASDNNNSSSNKNNNDSDRAKVTDEEESREEADNSRLVGRGAIRGVDAVAAVDFGLSWAGKSAPTPSSLPNWQFSIHKLPNQDSEVGRPTFNLPGPETRPRMRICFDPEHEIPKLQQWFQLNNHPSRLQVQPFWSQNTGEFRWRSMLQSSTVLIPVGVKSRST